MNQDNENQQTNGETSGSLSFDLDFAPSWARTEASVNIQRAKESYSRGEEGERGAGRRERDRSAPRRGRDGDSKGRDSRFRNRQDGQDRRPRRRDDSASNGEGRRERDRSAPRRPRREFHERLPLEVRVLPEQKTLWAIMRRIQNSHCAFPLRDLASLFLDKPASCMLRIEPLKGEELPLFQCKVCGMPALSEDEIKAHILNEHFGDFFIEEEVECAAPDGKFTCVAKCGLSGEYLGPPNHHSFAVKLREMLRKRFPDMSEDEYRSRIEMVRDPEAIEAWRSQCTSKKVYRRKSEDAAAQEKQPAAEGDKPASEEIPSMGREAAESLMTREIIPVQILRARHIVCGLTLALNSPNPALAYTCRYALNGEIRHPVSLFFALRGAFRHRELVLFRVNEPRGPEFVQFAKFSKLDCENAVPVLREILAFIDKKPGCTRQELVEKLVADGTTKEEEILTQLFWLVEKGHVIHFYNDTLSVPSDNPYFNMAARPQLKSASAIGGEKRPETAESAPVAEGEAVASAAPETEEVAAAPVETAESAAPAEEPGEMPESEAEDKAQGESQDAE